jgi:3-deoxy-D-manno-octulosonate 8-phosphate phosphatase (KDO 8-P phosphatase)
MSDRAFAERCQALRLLLTDVDGVMTDGRIHMFSGGIEGRSFHARDGLALAIAREAGLRTGILSGRESEVVRLRARELRMDVIREGAKDKGKVFREILAEENLEPRHVAYLGDDVNDIPVLAMAGLSGVPKDAPFEVRSEAFMVLESTGGTGCVREFVEAILRARGEWDRVTSSLFPR